MSFHLQVRPVPPCDDPAIVRSYLEEQRELLLKLVKDLNVLLRTPGCGLYVDSSGALAVRLNGSTIACSSTLGLSVTPSAIDHGTLGGLADDDHTMYLKEKASGGTAAEVPTHTHQSAGEAGTLDHGLALTGLTDDDHTQYVKKSLYTKKGDILVANAASSPSALGVSAVDGAVFTEDSGAAQGITWV